jgi:hypothetical protein
MFTLNAGGEEEVRCSRRLSRRRQRRMPFSPRSALARPWHMTPVRANQLHHVSSPQARPGLVLTSLAPTPANVSPLQLRPVWLSLAPTPANVSPLQLRPVWLALVSSGLPRPTCLHLAFRLPTQGKVTFNVVILTAAMAGVYRGPVRTAS